MGEAPEAIILIEDEEAVRRLEIGPDTKLAYLTQTTLSVDDANQIISKLREKFPHIQSPRKMIFAMPLKIEEAGRSSGGRRCRDHLG